MPMYQAPRADESRLGLLDQTAAAAPPDIAAGRPSITAATLAAVVAFIKIFRPLHLAVSKALQGRTKEIREREAARLELDTHVRDFYEVLKRRAHRLKQPAEVLTFYGLPLDGTNPVITTFADLVDAADHIVEGETNAVAAGYPAMANPSAAEIIPLLADARLQAADVPDADRAYDDAQTAVATRRPEADLLIEDIRSDLQSSLRRLDAASQRRVMRSYGCTFIPLPGEPEDPETGNTPPPTPSAPTNPTP